MKRRTLVLATVFGAATLVPPRARADDGFNVIVNQSNGVESLSRSDVKRLVSGSVKTWEGGAVVQLGIIPSDAAETRYLASLVEKTTSELLSLIQQGVFNGELRRPVILRSSADCLAFASSGPGGICIASSTLPVPSGARAVPVR
jgi:hypothetical protein